MQYEFELNSQLEGQKLETDKEGEDKRENRNYHIIAPGM